MSNPPRSAIIFGRIAIAIVGMPAHRSALIALGLYPLRYQYAPVSDIVNISSVLMR